MPETAWTLRLRPAGNSTTRSSTRSEHRLRRRADALCRYRPLAHHLDASGRGRLPVWPASRLIARGHAFGGADGEEAAEAVRWLGADGTRRGHLVDARLLRVDGSGERSGSRRRRVHHVGWPPGDRLSRVWLGVLDAGDRVEQAPRCRGGSCCGRAPGCRRSLTTWPPYITAMRSARPATTPRSWVMRIIAMS